MSTSTIKNEQGKQSAQNAGEKAKEGFQGAAQKLSEGVSAAAEKTREGFGMAAEKAREAVGVAADKARESMGAIRDSAGNFASSAVDRADEAVSGAGKKLEDWAEGVRSRTPNEGFLGQASEAVASSLESSGKYLEDHGVSGMVEDVTEMIKRNPIPALFIGIGIGFLLAKATSPRS